MIVNVFVCFDPKLFSQPSVPELNMICTDKCEDDQLECIIECESDVNCVSQCIRDGTKCIQGM